MRVPQISSVSVSAGVRNSDTCGRGRGMAADTCGRG
eukprot:CAMPEP_0118917508 /NCGR_PEP_ID=MMETSP1166-20130328/17366_1 /TAXON_ID=1104430 /ORGANISM="Chrysoreinhardia sp, Strain CCMP3193" /LENGTH=35 /DNA_ID= /DNA_START= /DNA_END= /DNA_ORIENTATION=